MDDNGQQRPQLPDEGLQTAYFVNEEGEDEPLVFCGFSRIFPSEIAKAAGGRVREEPAIRKVESLAEMSVLERDVVSGKFRPSPGLVTQFVATVATWNGRLRRR